MHEFYYSCICFEFSKTFQPVIFRKTKETVNVVGISILKWHRGLQYFCDAAFGTYLVGFLMSNEMRPAAEGPGAFRTLKGSLSCKICRILLQRWRQKKLSISKHSLQFLVAPSLETGATYLLSIASVGMFVCLYVCMYVCLWTVRI